MFEHTCSLRVRYSETDQMGVVYYGNYAAYFEVARVETMRALGFSYRQMEDGGVMLPVLEYKTKYIRSARYDDELFITTRIPEMPKTRIIFHYEIKDGAGNLLNTAETTLVFVDMAKGKPCMMPDYLKPCFAPWFPEVG